MSETLGIKTTFKWGGDTIAQLASINPPGPERNVIEVDDLNPTDEVKKKLAGLIDAGECTLTLNFDKSATGHAALQTDFWSATTKQSTITFPDNKGTCSFSGFIKSFAPQEIGAEDVFQVQVGIEVTTKATWS